MTHALFGLETDDCAECSRAHADSVARTQQEFARFYGRFQPRLLRYARRAWGARDAEEITQETLVRAYEAIDLGRDERSLWGWLVVVGRNVAADLARARRVCDVGGIAGETGPHETTVDPKCVEQTVLDSECLSTLGLALSALPPSQSRAWWLSVAEGMTPASIAESLACSPEAVRQALFKSRKRLAAAMAEFCDRTTAAFVVPVLLLMRRGSHRVGRSVAPAAANGLLSAAMLSTSALSATIAMGDGTAAPVLVARPLVVTSAADRADLVRTPHAVVPAVRTSRTSRSAAGAHPSAPLASSPVAADTWVSKKPLAPGRTAHEHIYVDTPLGTFGIDQEQRRSDGPGLVCGRVDQVHCDGAA